MEKIIERNLEDLLQSLMISVKQNTKVICDSARLISNTFSKSGKVLICGNGGSAADAQHLAAEFVSSFQLGLSRRALPAIALTTDTSILTAYSNDFDFRDVFVRQIEALGRESDLLIVFSTSGKSENCLRALKRAKELGLKTICFTRNSSLSSVLSDYVIGVNSSDTQRIQETHVFLYHTICQLVELYLEQPEQSEF